MSVITVTVWTVLMLLVCVIINLIHLRIHNREIKDLYARLEQNSRDIEDNSNRIDELEFRSD